MNLSELKGAFARGEIDKAAFIARAYGAHQYLFEYVRALAETNVAGIEVTEEGVRFSFSDPEMRLWSREGDRRTAPIEALNFGSYEKHELRTALMLIDSLGEEPGAILDVGANIGYYSIAIARANPERSVVSFEPIPATFELLRRNLELNGVENVKAVNAGVSDKSGEKSFFLSPFQSDAASAINLLEDENAEEIRCKILTMDSAIGVAGCDLPVKFIKCDVEGGELFAFIGGEGTIRRDRPIILTEMLRKWSAKFNYHPNDIIEFLNGMGYACHRLTGDGLISCLAVDEDTIETNFVFLHSVAHATQTAQFVRSF